MAEVETSLHPNLARIAASYQQILGRMQRGELSVTHAHVEIRELIARDDDGVQWTINPEDGGWLFLSRSGSWMPADPPRSGYATLTPHDLRSVAGDMPVAYNPDWDLTMQRAADSSDGLRGSTRRRPSIATQSRVQVWRWVAIAAAAAIAVLMLWSIVNRDVELIAPGPIVQVPAQ